MKKIFQSKAFAVALYIILGLLVVIIIFALGMGIGFRRGTYDQAWKSHYLDNFGPAAHGRPPEAHGAIGQIISVQLPSVIVEDQSGIEKTVAIGPTTIIRSNATTVAASELAPDQFIVVVGDPQPNGQISARFIRIIPKPDELQSQNP